MVRKIQHKRGPEKDLPRLEIAEWALTTDTEKPFIGAASGNVEIAKKKDLEAVSSEVSKKADAAEVTALGSQLAEKASQEDITAAIAPKADVSYVDAELSKRATKTELENVLDGSPKGVYATLTDLQTAFPTGAQGVYVVQADGHIYYWDGSAWADAGLYQAQEVADKGITAQKLATNTVMDAHFYKAPFYSAGNKNLFNEDETTDNQTVRFDTGEVGAGSNWFVSDFIPIKPGTTYTITKHGQLAFYDANKVYISGQGNTSPLYQNLTVTSPDNAYFIRVSSNVSNKREYQLEEGSTATAYARHFKGGRLYDKSVKRGALDDAAVTEKNIERHEIADKALKYLPVETIRGKNLFDKEKITSNVYIQFNTGREAANATYNASDFILVEPNTNYAIYKKDQLSFYDENHRFISGIGGTADYQVITTPSNAKYIRMSVSDANLNLVQIEKGTVSTVFEEYKEKATPSDLFKELPDNSLISYNALYEHLENPFIKTKVKLVGDSITAGVGGTGYDLSGPFMFKDYRNVDRYENINTAVSWSNSLKNFLEEKYNKDVYADLEHGEFKIIERDTTQTLNSNSFNFFFWTFPNRQAGKPMAEFSFYGDHFSLYHITHSAGGIFEIVVDGEVKQTVDTYAATSTYNVETAVTGLTLGNHTVELRSTDRANTASTGNAVRISGLKIPKHVEVRNWGISGIRTLDAYFDREKLIEATDDIVFIQLGTNDRIPSPSLPATTPSRSKKLLKVVVERALEVGADVYLMAAPPATPSNETDPVRAFHMEDVHNYIKKLAEEMKLPFISHFLEYYRYMRYTGATLDSLLADGLHPNDAGYDIMFKKIMQETEIGLTYDGVPTE